MIKSTFSLLLLLDYTPEVAETQHVIEQLQPALTQNEALERALAIEFYANELKLPKYQWLAIMFQESSLWLDPTECLVKTDNCTPDYGIGQVNYQVWGDHLEIDRIRALSEVGYSVNISAKVLADYKRRYSSKTTDWIYKYHSTTPALKNLYRQRIDAVYGRIKAYLEEYRDEKRLGIRNFRPKYCGNQDGTKKVPAEIFESIIRNF